MKKMQNRENTIRESGNGVGARRAYKARLFEMIFSDRKELLALYNAVNGTAYEDPERVRTYAGTMSLKNAVERAVEECIRDNVLAEFLRNNRAEAMKVSIYEYDEEKTMRQMREEGHEEGVKEGREEGEKSFAILAKRLLEDSRQDDLLKAADDREFREKLYQEYGLKE